jgi:carbon starvation protein
MSGTDQTLWPLFGSTNQLLAGLSLVVVTVWLKKSGRPWLYTGIPMILVVLVAGLSMATNIMNYWASRNLVLMFVGSFVLALEIWVVLEGVAAMRRLGKAETSVP